MIFMFICGLFLSCSLSSVLNVTAVDSVVKKKKEKKL